MAKKEITIAKTEAYFPKSKTNQISLRYIYQLCRDSEHYYYIYRAYYQNGKLISIHNFGASKNRKQIIERYKSLTSDILEIL